MHFKFPSNKTLAKISIYGAVTCISAVMYMRFKIQDRIRNQDYFREAFKTLRSSPGAIKLLGEPIKELGFDLSDPQNNYCDGRTAKFEVVVKGSKDRGKMHFIAEKIKDGWILKTLDLEVKSHPDKKFLVKKEDEESRQTAQ